ncbi:MAG: hypothetical protein C0403_20005, partial [Desulfobacterium sp.]|nr:hypothetical protein [Desulfobacterium sp.]
TCNNSEIVDTTLLDLIHSPLRVSLEKKECAVFTESMLTKLPSDVITGLAEKIPQLEGHLMDQWQKIKKNHDIDSIEEFARQIEQLGDETGILPLLEFGEKLASFSRAFDVDHIQIQLQAYPSLVEQLKQTVIRG